MIRLQPIRPRIIHLHFHAIQIHPNLPCPIHHKPIPHCHLPPRVLARLRPLRQQRHHPPRNLPPNLAPALAWIVEISPLDKWKPWKRELLRAALVAVPIIIAIILAAIQFKKDSAGMEM